MKGEPEGVSPGSSAFFNSQFPLSLVDKFLIKICKFGVFAFANSTFYL